MKSNLSRKAIRGFSLVEVLAAVTIIGIIVYLAIPNIVQIRQDAEDGLAKSRAEALNVAAAAYFQASGTQQALATWTDGSHSSSDARYTLVRPYLAFAPSTMAAYMPAGYAVEFSSSAPHKEKATLYFTNASGSRQSVSY